VNEAEALTNLGWFYVFVLGMTVGLTACTVTCLPYLGTWAVGRGQSSNRALIDTAAFAMGKILAYALLGAAAGYMGEALAEILNGNLGHWLIGFAAIFAGGWLALSVAKPVTPCNRVRRGQHASPLLMGFALGFTPCPPLAALVGACAALGSPTMGFFYGGVFGLGAAITPLFLVIPLLASFGRSLQTDRPWLKKWLYRVAGGVLIAIGLRRITLGI